MKIEINKPVIPQFVADWVESRDYYNVYKVLQDLSAPGSPHASKDVRNWIFRNQENVEKFVRAWLYGYEVEQEPKYYARIKGWELIADERDIMYWMIDEQDGGLFVGDLPQLPFNSRYGYTTELTVCEWNELGVYDDVNAVFILKEDMNESNS